MSSNLKNAVVLRSYYFKKNIFDNDFASFDFR